MKTDLFRMQADRVMGEQGRTRGSAERWQIGRGRSRRLAAVRHLLNDALSREQFNVAAGGATHAGVDGGEREAPPR